MNVVLISRSSALSDSIRNQLHLRERPLVILSNEDLPSFDTTLLRNAIVVDGDALVCFQSCDGVEPELHEQLLGERRRLLQACREMDTPYIFLSDGRVFDANTEQLHDCSEDEDTAAFSLAGKQLAEFERLVIGVAGQGLVLRTGPLIAAQEGNFLGDCLVTMRDGNVLTLNDALMGCPTPVSDLARVVSGMLDQLSCGAPCRGIYHYNSSGAASAYEFAEVVCAFASQFVAPVADIAAADAGITWIPKVPVLSCDQLLQDFGIKQLPWRAYLPRMVRAICEGVSK
ncbi:sugar nucleotide-binding protein [Zhongshania aliphaticivorans]|uniref:sugar nucleotide-binding protein n=1 Tax=Zhongshania aliphaticivorans TaxID=1470434 RepID=UPI00133001D8|nr:sugar nucleotide-binding protein [Zhongshania aliphaticivorans]